RRHTRFSRDWSSDVCSSDLFAILAASALGAALAATPITHSPAVSRTAQSARKVLWTASSIRGADMAAPRAGSINDPAFGPAAGQIGRASCRERACVSVVDVG